jgi:hypothetical protein
MRRLKVIPTLYGGNPVRLPASRAPELAIILDHLRKLDLTSAVAILVRMEEVYADAARADTYVRRAVQISAA